jgi:hypothetical protein
MQHEPQDTNPTTHREPDDVEAHGLGGKKVPPAAEGVQAHKWANKPPIVDDVEAHAAGAPISPARSTEDDK